MRQVRRKSESQLQWTVEVAATALFWGLWAYFITPLLSLVLWYFGYQVFVEEMFELGGFEALQEQLRSYGLVIFSIFFVTGCWVMYNRLRYGGAHNTRTHMLAPVTLVETADVAGLKPAQAEAVQGAKRLVVSFDDSDHLLLRKSRATRASSNARKGRVSLSRRGRKV